MFSVRRVLYAAAAVVVAGLLVAVGLHYSRPDAGPVPVAGTEPLTRPGVALSSERLHAMLLPPSAHPAGSTITELTLSQFVAGGYLAPPSDLVVTPARCADGLGDGVSDPANTTGWVQLGTTPSGTVFYAVAAWVPGGASFHRIRETIAACSAATVTLTSFGITGTLRLSEFAGPRLPGAQTIGVAATTSFPTSVPPAAQLLVAALNSDTVYVAQGSLLEMVCECDPSAAASSASLMYYQSLSDPTPLTSSTASPCPSPSPSPTTS